MASLRNITPINYNEGSNDDDDEEEDIEEEGGVAYQYHTHMPGNQVKLQKGICLWSCLLLPPKNLHRIGQLNLILHKRHIKRQKNRPR
jgi:hypothetical protein